LVDYRRANRRQAHGVTTLRATLVALLAVLLFAALADSALAALPQQEIAAEERAEATEEAEEEVEEASTLAALNSSVSQLSPYQARVIAACVRHLSSLKGMIAQIRESKKVDQTLPHTTTRWLVHVPKKLAHIKELRVRMRTLRLRIVEVRSG